jgi:hypothetical protein
VFCDVLVTPAVEPEDHRLAIHLSEQRLDMCDETQRLISLEWLKAQRLNRHLAAYADRPTIS